jgi:hypothetical protein
VAFTAIQLVVGYQIGQFVLPGGEVLVYAAAGDALRAGADVYAGAPGTETFYYAPTWALFFAAFSWLGPVALQVVMWIVDVACLRYLAGSWLRVGYLLWMPLMAFELASGQVNLILAAGIVAGLRGASALTVPGVLAKLSPILAVRRPRPFLVALGVALLVTLPWLGMWATWIVKLAGASTLHVGNPIPIPLPIRLVVAAGLLVVGSLGAAAVGSRAAWTARERWLRPAHPWAVALAATISIPAFHWASLVVLIAPIVVWADARWPIATSEARPATPPRSTPVPQPSIPQPT